MAEKKSYTKHHLRPRSRGGSNASENLKHISHEKSHKPYHYLFTNLRPHEIIFLFFLSWNTQYIPALKHAFWSDKFSTTMGAWQNLFGSRSVPRDAGRVLVRMFVKSREDKILNAWALRACERIAEGRGIYITEKKASAEERTSWRVHTTDRYIHLFGKLDPHEAILLTYFSWETINPYKEFTHATTAKIKRKSMRNRKEAWNNLFGKDATPSSALSILEGLCPKDYYPQTHALVQEAMNIIKESR